MFHFSRFILFGSLLLIPTFFIHSQEPEEDIVASRDRDRECREERPTIFDLDEDEKQEQRALYGPRYYHCEPMNECPQQKPNYSPNPG